MARAPAGTPAASLFFVERAASAEAARRSDASGSSASRERPVGRSSQRRSATVRAPVRTARGTLECDVNDEIVAVVAVEIRTIERDLEPLTLGRVAQEELFAERRLTDRGGHRDPTELFARRGRGAERVHAHGDGMRADLLEGRLRRAGGPAEGIPRRGARVSGLTRRAPAGVAFVEEQAPGERIAGRDPRRPRHGHRRRRDRWRERARRSRQEAARRAFAPSIRKAPSGASGRTPTTWTNPPRISPEHPTGGPASRATADSAAEGATGELSITYGV